jgi:arginase family enzyme
MTVITADEVHEKGCEYFSDQCREVIGGERSYLSLDVDSLDSSVMMGTTGPEPFGLTARQVRQLIHGARGLNLVGADLVELNPNRDPSGSCAHLAAALFFELMSVLTDIKGADATSGVTDW